MQKRQQPTERGPAIKIASICPANGIREAPMDIKKKIKNVPIANGHFPVSDSLASLII